LIWRRISPRAELEADIPLVGFEDALRFALAHKAPRGSGLEILYDQETIGRWRTHSSSGLIVAAGDDFAAMGFDPVADLVDATRFITGLVLDAFFQKLPPCLILSRDGHTWLA